MAATSPVVLINPAYSWWSGRGYCFAGGWRHIAHHAVTELKEEGRVVLLWRFWLPGRVGLVPMFKGRDKVFMGYRRLNKVGTACDW